jgi:hypothetical protein
LKVYVANFGYRNFAWPECLERAQVVTMQDERVQEFWRAGDKKGYIDYCVANLRTQKGIAPIRSVAGRWFNLGSIITESSGDLWLHQDGKFLWWTVTTESPAIIELGVDPGVAPGEPAGIYYYRKPARPWSNQNKIGQTLEWRAIHPKAPDFLITEATLQRLSEDYAGYAMALIKGNDLSAWHEQPEWREKTDGGSRKQPGVILNARQRTFATMALSARDTAAVSNGQQVLKKVKEKDFRFSSAVELENYISDLFDAQEGLCAVTGLKLNFAGEGDPQLCCSLDRIDSGGHYETGNLQVVCRFINFWKSDADDTEFRRLIEVVRHSVGF